MKKAPQATILQIKNIFIKRRNNLSPALILLFKSKEFMIVR